MPSTISDNNHSHKRSENSSKRPVGKSDGHKTPTALKTVGMKTSKQQSLDKSMLVKKPLKKIPRPESKNNNRNKIVPLDDIFPRAPFERYIRLYSSKNGEIRFSRGAIDVIMSYTLFVFENIVREAARNCKTARRIILFPQDLLDAYANSKFTLIPLKETKE